MCIPSFDLGDSGGGSTEFGAVVWGKVMGTLASAGPWGQFASTMLAGAGAGNSEWARQENSESVRLTLENGTTADVKASDLDPAMLAAYGYGYDRLDGLQSTRADPEDRHEVVQRGQAWVRTPAGEFAPEVWWIPTVTGGPVNPELWTEIPEAAEALAGSASLLTRRVEGDLRSLVPEDERVADRTVTVQVQVPRDVQSLTPEQQARIVADVVSALRKPPPDTTLGGVSGSASVNDAGQGVMSGNGSDGGAVTSGGQLSATDATASYGPAEVRASGGDIQRPLGELSVNDGSQGMTGNAVPIKGAGEAAPGDAQWSVVAVPDYGSALNAGQPVEISTGQKATQFARGLGDAGLGLGLGMLEYQFTSGMGWRFFSDPYDPNNLPPLYKTILKDLGREIGAEEALRGAVPDRFVDPLSGSTPMLDIVDRYDGGAVGWGMALTESYNPAVRSVLGIDRGIDEWLAGNYQAAGATAGATAVDVATLLMVIAGVGLSVEGSLAAEPSELAADGAGVPRKGLVFGQGQAIEPQPSARAVSGLRDRCVPASGATALRLEGVPEVTAKQIWKAAGEPSPQTGMTLGKLAETVNKLIPEVNWRAVEFFSNGENPAASETAQHLETIVGQQKGSPWIAGTTDGVEYHAVVVEAVDFEAQEVYVLDPQPMPAMTDLGMGTSYRMTFEAFFLDWDGEVVFTR